MGQLDSSFHRTYLLLLMQQLIELKDMMIAWNNKFQLKLQWSGKLDAIVGEKQSSFMFNMQ